MCARSTRRWRPFLEPGQLIVSATKGIEDQTFLRMTQVIEQVLADQNLDGIRPGVLSGPSFAQEVAAGAPTAITIAFAESALANRLQEELSAPALRLYTNDDVIGVELGGALKNVIAIAAGIAAGLGLGHNSAAAIITRGVAEITRLAVACGGRRETLAGLSGLGDLVLTCTGPLSRNRSVGVELGRGHKLPAILAQLQGKVAEGVRTTSAALGLARAHRRGDAHHRADGRHPRARQVAPGRDPRTDGPARPRRIAPALSLPSCVQSDRCRRRVFPKKSRTSPHLRCAEVK